MARLLILFTLLLSACALGPDYERPVLPVHTSYKTEVGKTSEIVNLSWWEVYQDPMLQELINLALENNLDLQIAASRIEQSRARLGFVKADHYPAINLSGTLNRQEFESSRSSDRSNEGYQLSTPLSWELDFWGRIRRSTEANRAELFASEEFYRFATISLVADVASAYFSLLDLRNRLEISQQTLIVRKDYTAIIQARYDEGYIAKLDLHQAQVEEESAAAAVEQFTRAAQQVENALSVLIGDLPKEIISTEELVTLPAFPDIPAGLPSELIDRRPDIRRAEELLRAQNARIGVAQANRLPRISLTAAYGVESTDLSEFRASQDRFWSIGGDLFGPLLSANKNISRVDLAIARTKELALSYEKTVLQAFQEVEDSLIAVQTFYDEYEARRRQVISGKNAARLSRARYDAGETSYLEVLDTERALFNNELLESEALRDKLNATVTLYKALGGGWEYK